MGRAGRSGGGGIGGGGSNGGRGFGGWSSGSRGFGGWSSGSSGKNRGGSSDSGGSSGGSGWGQGPIIPTFIPVPRSRPSRNTGPIFNDDERYSGGGPNRPYSGNSTPPRPPKNPKDSFRTALLVTIPAMVLCIILLLLNPGGNEKGLAPLEKGIAAETGYYTDELGWIHNSSVLEQGMKLFYERTGVRPYLYLTDKINGKHDFNANEAQVFLTQKYDELFDDEAHMILLYVDNGSNYTIWYLAGSQAETVIDYEAASIVKDYVMRYYNSSYDDDTYFSKVFEESSAKIMAEPTHYLQIGCIIVLLICLIILAYHWSAYRGYQRKQEADETVTILNTPIEELVDQSLQDLENKYTDKK